MKKHIYMKNIGSRLTLKMVKIGGKNGFIRDYEESQIVGSST